MSNRNFDHRVVIERQRALQTAQGLYRATVMGKTIVANPQNSDSSPQIIAQFQEGYQTAYYKGLLGGNNDFVASPGGIQNILIEQNPPVRVILPSPPTSLVGTPAVTQISVAFVAGDAGTGPIINYEYSVDGGATFTTCSPAVTSSPIVITGLTPSTTYSIALKAVTPGGTSLSSSVISVTTGATPSAPTITGITAGNTELSVAFTAPASDGGSAITNYQYSTNNGSSWTSRSPAATTSPIVITGLSNGTTYTVRIRAVNAYGTGTMSSSATGTPVAPPPLPSAPTLISALPGNNLAYVYFTPVGSGQANYDYSLNNGATWTSRSPAATTSPMLITGLTNGVAATIVLRATNATGESVASNSVTVTPSAANAYSSALQYDETSYSGSGSSVTNQAPGGISMTGTKSAGITYVAGTGLVGKNVFDFNGGDNISFGNYNFGSAFTVVAWVYPRDRFSINGLLANVGANQAPLGFKIGWNWWNTTSYAMLFEGGNGASGSAPSTVASIVTPNTWQQLVYVIDKANSRVYFLKNGVPATASNITTVDNFGTNNPAFYIGSFTDGSYSMNAQLASLKVIPRLLNVSEVEAEFNATKSAYGL